MSVQAGGSTPKDPVQGVVPKATEVAKFHTNADTDGGRNSIHHTLGSSNAQAAAGDHDHRGGDSVALLLGSTIQGSRTDGTAVASIIAILVDLGATDATTS